MTINQAQITAVRHGEGPMLVLAGPGSGKTRVVTERTKYLITERGVSPEHILVITFTRAAAAQMQERFTNSMGGRRFPVTFGTFHAVFFQMLKYAYGYTSANIVTEEQRIALIREAIDKEDLETEDETDLIQSLLSEIGIVKNDQRLISEYEALCCDSSLFRRIFKYYEEGLHRMRKMDFDDMLVYCYELLNARKDILSLWQEKYQYILVDEFQDVNRIQYEIIKMLAGDRRNLFIVGDDDQSIYQFRGARPEIMQEFLEDYPEAKRVLLDVNYRSTVNIVEKAQCLIGHNRHRFDKAIRAERGSGAPVYIQGFQNVKEETEYLVQDIRRKVAEGVSPEEIAVVYRIGTQPRPLLEKMMEYNLPFQLRDGMPDIYQHWIARDIISYIRIGMGSKERRYFLTVMNRPNRYISREAVESIQISFENLREYYREKEWMTERIDKFWYDAKMIGRIDPYAAISYIRRAVGYEEYIKEYAKERRIPENELLDVLEELSESAKGYKNFESWFAHIRKFQETWQEQMRKNREKRSAAAFMTMHGSKGLEYKVVYLLEANEEIIPHKKAVTDEEIEEERRMFYVAMTRAKDELHICWVKERFSRGMEPSRFVGELLYDRRAMKAGVRVVHQKYGEGVLEAIRGEKADLLFEKDGRRLTVQMEYCIKKGIIRVL